jgi:hypothetical protein
MNEVGRTLMFARDRDTGGSRRALIEHAPDHQPSAVAEVGSEHDESGSEFRPPAVGRMAQHPRPRR